MLLYGFRKVQALHDHVGVKEVEEEDEEEEDNAADGNSDDSDEKQIWQVDFCGGLRKVHLLQDHDI